MIWLNDCGNQAGIQSVYEGKPMREFRACVLLDERMR